MNTIFERSKTASFPCEIKSFLDIFGFPIHENRGIHQKLLRNYLGNRWEGWSKMEFPQPAPISQLEVHLWFLLLSLFSLSKMAWNGMEWLNKGLGTFSRSESRPLDKWWPKCHLAFFHRPNFFSFSGEVRSTGPYTSGRPEGQNHAYRILIFSVWPILFFPL